MSRIGKMPIPIPKGVEVSFTDGKITVLGPKGKLNYCLLSQVKVEISEKEIKVLPPEEIYKALYGLTRALIANMVLGVTNGFQKTLQITGVGYRAKVEKKSLILNIGFTHPVIFSIPEGLAINVKGNLIEISGIDKQLVGSAAAQIRAFKKSEPYKGKGISYQGEQIRRKVGKRGAGVK